MLLRISLFCLALSSSIHLAYAAEPIAAPKAVGVTILGTSRVDPYKIVRLKITGAADGAGILWDIRSANPTTPLNYDDIDWETTKDGPYAAFSAKPGKYIAEAVVVTVSDDNGKRKVGISKPQFAFEIAPPPPAKPVTPPKPPTPPTPVAPKLSAGKYGLAQFTFDSITASVKTGAPVAAKGVATAYGDVVKKVRDGSIKTIELVLATAGNQVSAALKPLTFDRDGWRVSGSAIENKLYELYQTKKLVTASDFADAFEEIIAGLNAIK